VPSQYYFSIETEYGKKIVQVTDAGTLWEFREVKKEAIELLVQKGSTVEVRGIPESDLDKEVYLVSARNIRLVDEK
jgi:hypothetical protein